MRDWILVVVLLIFLLVELAWTQWTGGSAGTNDPDELISNALGASAIHEPSGPAIFDWLDSGSAPGGRSTVEGILRVFVPPSASGQSSSLSIFGRAPDVNALRPDKSLAPPHTGRRIVTHRDTQYRHVGSATSTIPR